MRDFFDWARATGLSQQPWLILGKGPSFSKLSQFNISDFKTISLNHVVRERPVDLAHIIDIDVVEHVGDALFENAGHLVMPWIPHDKVNPDRDGSTGMKTLSEWAAEIPVLRRLHDAGRLLWYNCSTSARVRPGSPIVEVIYFSFEGAFHLLAMAGAQKVRSLGVDGGSAYSGRFQDLNESTRLSNGHPSFDIQFRQIAKIRNRYGLSYAPLDSETPVRVFIGAQPEQRLAVDVLKFSIRRQSSVDVDAIAMCDSNIEIPSVTRAELRPTPFSFQRFTIPELKGYSGRGIYLDSDMLLFEDIRKLWLTEMQDHDVLNAAEPVESGRRPQYSVMLLDCSRLAHWNVRQFVSELNNGTLSYADLMFDMKKAARPAALLSPAWNSLECFEENFTANLHYTDFDRQPWLSTVNPNAHLWFKELFLAIDAGVVTRGQVVLDVLKSDVRPSLYFQLRARLLDPLKIPEWARRLDADFIPRAVKSPLFTSQHRFKYLRRCLALVLKFEVFFVLRGLKRKFRSVRV